MSERHDVRKIFAGIDLFAHFRSETTEGHVCPCGAEAWHKVGEEIAYDDPSVGRRHNFTAFVCCECFGRIMGPVAIKWCEGDLT